MRIFVIIATMMLGACSTVPKPELGEAKAVQVPALSEKLSQRAERLPDITDGSPAGIQRDGIATDRQYNAVANQTNALIKVYNCVRDAVNSRNADAAKKCLEEK